MNDERNTIAEAGRPVARAAARQMVTRARAIIMDAEKILGEAGDYEAERVAQAAGEATTALLAATYDGDANAFACKR